MRGSRLVWSLVLLGSASTFLLGCITTIKPMTHQHIAYTRAEQGGGVDEIWMMNDDGSQPHMVNTGASNNLEPSWAPDGSRLVFTSTRNGGQVDLFTADIVAIGDGTYRAENVTAKTNDPQDDSSANWSNQCARIAFASNRADQNNYDIYQLDLGTTVITRLTANPAEDLQPSWSPDGSKIAFVRKSNVGGEIYVLDVASGNEARLTSNALHDTDPSWSPSGRIIFSRVDGDRERIYEMDSSDANGDGNGDHLTAITTPSAGQYDGLASYSPTGTHVIFTRLTGADGGPPGDIWVRNLSAGTEQNLTQTATQHEHGGVYQKTGACLKH